MHWNPWTFITVAVAGWMNQRQQEAIEYLKEENRILREKLGHKRLILNVAQKRRLASAAKKLGRDLLAEVGTLFSPETLLKWHSRLCRMNWPTLHGETQSWPRQKNRRHRCCSCWGTAADFKTCGLGGKHGQSGRCISAKRPTMPPPPQAWGLSRNQAG